MACLHLKCVEQATIGYGIPSNGQHPGKQFGGQSSATVAAHRSYDAVQASHTFCNDYYDFFYSCDSGDCSSGNVRHNGNRVLVLPRRASNSRTPTICSTQCDFRLSKAPCHCHHFPCLYLQIKSTILLSLLSVSLSCNCFRMCTLHVLLWSLFLFVCTCVCSLLTFSCAKQ